MKKNITPILFLDIDGPLVNDRTYVGLASPGDKATLAVAGLDLNNFDPVGVGIINSLCKETGALVVISSTWKHFDGQSRNIIFGKEAERPNDPFDLREHLRSVGLDVPYHKDWKTFPKLSGSRGLEIKDWLDDHPKVKWWCAIDDDNSFSIEMRSNLVLVDAENGISFKDYLKARSLLRK